MKLWVTSNGDRWLCDDCEKELQGRIDEEQWRTAFERWEPLLRCSECKRGDVEIPD